MASVRLSGIRGMGIHCSARINGTARAVVAIGSCLLLANCVSSGKYSRVDPKYGVSSSPRVVAFGEPVPKGGGTYRVGKPYTVAGRVYVPQENPNYRAEGLASWYGDNFHGRLTANGEVFDMDSLTAAHPTMPIPSYARVTNLSNGKSLIVRVNDRGPYHGNRIIDVSNRAAHLLDFKGQGIARVRVEYVGRAPLEGSDDRQLVATLRTGEPAPSPSTVRVASARPFIPEPSHASVRAVRRDVPVPGERPYSLGNAVAEADAADTTPEPPPSRVARVERAPLESRQVVSYGDRSHVAASRVVSAYAPVERQDSPREILSGRGLY